MKTTIRQSNGSIVALAFVALVPLILAIGGFSVDCMHFNDQRGAMQRATDAGALAGAIDIPSWKGNLSQSGTTNSGTNYTTGKIGTNEEPVDMALAATGLNVVDGNRPVTNGSTINVFAELLQQYTPNMTQSGNGHPPIACHVHAQMQIRSLFAGMFGNWTQTVSTDSVAGPGPQITTLYRYLPMLLSAPQGDQNGSMLSAMGPGAMYGFILNAAGAAPPSGNGGKGNSVWIFNSDAANQAAVNAIANGVPMNPAEPSITVDTSITTQLPGFSSPGALASFNSLTPGTIFIVPVTSDWLTLPNPTTGAQPSTGPHPVIGFLALRIQNAMTSGSYWCQIVPAIGSGTNTGIPQDPNYATYGFLPTDRVSSVSLVR